MFGKKRNQLQDREAALIELIQEHKLQLYRIAYSYVKNEQDALDVVQEATYKAIVNQEKLKEEAYMKSWLIRILINCAVDVLRKRENGAQAPEVWVGASANQGMDTEAVMDLREAIQGLDETQKRLIHLKYFEDLKLEEIAGIMEMPLGTVKSQLHRIVKRLRIELKEVEVFE
ncbi:MAG: sigma-70 family RNA polymerase sigma factor [Acidaminobacter sp.]|uniref:sigma-70 family RNA polymerase sigma factor n=1 Tax=Acidaminobacter sp. TaxID=1872102 RepID=UPI00138389A6|nr:sigma-70 family RNA polymerase sigma factor [Acidaminobacter sp.]MZQ97724.1 sigma-70 family RNA polymerase sigma factor [Acidaminobacter sp.]